MVLGTDGDRHRFDVLHTYAKNKLTDFRTDERRKVRTVELATSARPITDYVYPRLLGYNRMKMRATKIHQDYVIKLSIPCCHPAVK